MMGTFLDRRLAGCGTGYGFDGTRPLSSAESALDVLFNKKEWTVWSSDRRDVWRPAAYSVARSAKGISQSQGELALDFVVQPISTRVDVIADITTMIGVFYAIAHKVPYAG